MSGIRLNHGTWLAVCDGTKALLIENMGDKQFPKFETRESFKQDDPPTHMQGASPPGRAFGTVGNRRGAVEQTDFHQQAEEYFLREFAKTIDRAVYEHRIKSLMLIAPAHALGYMRSQLSAATHEIVVGELARDYVKLPLYEMESHLAKVH